MDLAARHIRNRLPEGITAKIISYPVSTEAYVLPLKHPAIRVLEEIDQRIYGKEPKFLRSGGTLPLPSMFLKLFGKYLIAFGPYSFVENVHGPNEFIYVENLLSVKIWLPVLVRDF